jgi:rfaE bifunctional protein kinase chain/domain
LNFFERTGASRAAARELRASCPHGSKIVFVSGNFNAVHPGHLRLLKFAAEQADVLVVGVNHDNSPGVSLPQEMRLENVRSIAMVKHAIALDASPTAFIAVLQPDVVVKGKEFETRLNQEKSVVETYGGRLVFSSGEVGFTSLALLEREYSEPNHSTIAKPNDFPDRHGFDMSTLRSTLGKIAGMRVLVIGDLIIDEYVTCDPIGMSQEDPTIVVTPIASKTFVGGSGAVAAHANGLGADVNYCTVTGQDEFADFARDELRGQGVNQHFFVDSTRPTTRKQRFRALSKTLLRVNHLRHHPASQELQRQILQTVEAALPKTDLILFSCFNYGSLPQPLVDAITERAQARGVMMAADSQASSQIGDVSRFKKMALITPTEREARLAVNDFETGLAAIGQQLLSKARADNLVITLGAEGMLIHPSNSSTFPADRLPAFNSFPKDVSGAGDSFFLTAAMSLRTGADIWQSSYLGAIAAALQVSRVGNAPLAASDILAELDDDKFEFATRWH